MKNCLILGAGLLLCLACLGLFAHGFFSLWIGKGNFLSLIEIVIGAFAGAAAVEVITPASVSSK